MSILDGDPEEVTDPPGLGEGQPLKTKGDQVFVGQGDQVDLVVGQPEPNRVRPYGILPKASIQHLNVKGHVLSGYRAAVDKGHDLGEYLYQGSGVRPSFRGVPIDPECLRYLFPPKFVVKHPRTRVTGNGPRRRFR